MSFLLFSLCLAELLLFVVFSSSSKVLASLPRNLFVMINLQQKYQLLHHLVACGRIYTKSFFSKFAWLQFWNSWVWQSLSLLSWSSCSYFLIVLLFELKDHGQFFSLSENASESSVGFLPSDSESQLPGEEVALWVLRWWWTIMFLFKIFFSLYWFLGI